MAPAISDGNTQGTLGMRYSLISRDWIADCVEIMHEGYMADACITLGACDKTVPGAVMPLARCNTSGCFIYGGPLVPGQCNPPLRADAPAQYHRGLDAGSVVEASGSFSAGLIDLEELHRIECDALPRSGTCSGMFTANTMTSVVEALGMSMPEQAAHVAVDEQNVPTDQKQQDCADAVATFTMLRSR
jgi:dihydroxy-acid dehydratase